MVAEQVSTSRYWSATMTAPREIRLTVRLESPGEEGVNVATTLSFMPPISEPWGEAIDRLLYAGVHDGLGSAARPLPAQGITVSVTELVLEPPLDAATDPLVADRVGETIRAMTAAAVGALWSGLDQGLDAAQ